MTGVVMSCLLLSSWIPAYCARQTTRLFVGHSPEAYRQRAVQSVAPAQICAAQEGGGFVVMAVYA